MGFFPTYLVSLLQFVLLQIYLVLHGTSGFPATFESSSKLVQNLRHLLSLLWKQHKVTCADKYPC